MKDDDTTEMTVKELTRSLAEPFDPRELKYKPQTVKGDRAIAVAYIDARLIQDRLDEVLGVENWQDDYEPLPGGSVLCRLRVKLGDQWITKMDVGSPSEQPDEGDRTKAAFSDALKRAAVKFGIGRYLYRLPVQWVDYDAQKKRIVKPPALPDFAIPRPATAKARVSNPAPRPEAKPPKTKPLPEDGAELHRKLRDYDAKLSAQGLCEPGALLEHVRRAGVAAGHPDDIDAWDGSAIALGAEETRRFRHRLGEKQAA